jgi:hypothetical protein
MFISFKMQEKQEKSWGNEEIVLFKGLFSGKKIMDFYILP